MGLPDTGFLHTLITPAEQKNKLAVADSEITSVDYYLQTVKPFTENSGHVTFLEKSLVKV
jgi:hypothetical protein